MPLTLFGEGQSRVVVSVKPEQEAGLVNHLKAQSISFTKLGQTEGQSMVVDNEPFGEISSWKPTYDHQLGEQMEQ